NPSSWERHGYSKRGEPAQQGLKRQENDRPEHPLGEPSADGERHRSLAPQTDTGNYQRQQRSRGRQQEQDRDNVVEQLRYCHLSYSPNPDSHGEKAFWL